MQFNIPSIIVEELVIRENQTAAEFVEEELLTNLETATTEEKIQLVFGVDEVLKNRCAATFYVTVRELAYFRKRCCL